ncbi:MAG: hypothetical protein KGY41_09260 [Desulfovermiculus sp.]|nr:hypothetical protein [Desulfovermiculus sp.]
MQLPLAPPVAFRLICPWQAEWPGPATFMFRQGGEYLFTKRITPERDEKHLFHRRQGIGSFLAGFRHAKKKILSILIILSKYLLSYNIFKITQNPLASSRSRNNEEVLCPGFPAASF